MMVADAHVSGRTGLWLVLAVVVLALSGCPKRPPAHPAGPGQSGKARDAAGAELKIPKDKKAQLAFARKKMLLRDDFVSVSHAVEAYRRILSGQRPSADLLAEAVAASCRAAEIAESDADVKRYVTLTLAWADRGIQSFPQRVEFPYRKAVAIGIQTERVSKNALGRVKQLEKLLLVAVKLDERYDHAGPLRLLGAVYVNAPEVGSIGDPDKGVALLKKAVALFSSYPPNHFFLGEGYFKQEEFDKAAKEFRGVLDAGSSPDYSDRDAEWFRERARNYLKKIRRQNSGQDI